MWLGDQFFEGAVHAILRAQEASSPVVHITVKLFNKILHRMIIIVIFYFEIIPATLQM